MCKMPHHQSIVKWLRDWLFLKGVERERATYRGKQTHSRSCPESDPCKTRGTEYTHARASHGGAGRAPACYTTPARYLLGLLVSYRATQVAVARLQAQ